MHRAPCLWCANPTPTRRPLSPLPPIDRRRSRNGRLTLVGFAALEQLSPPLCGDLDVVTFCCGLDPFPRAIPVRVSDAFDLIETRDGVTDVASVGQGFLTLVRKRELAVFQSILLCGTQPGGWLWDLRSVRTRALGVAGLFQVAA